MTTAEKIAAQFDNDGLRFEDASGNALEAVCDDAAVRGEKARSQWDDERKDYIAVPVSWGESAYDRIRYIFADCSAIVIAGEAWDIEGAEPFSWSGS